MRESPCVEKRVEGVCDGLPNERTVFLMRYNYRQQGEAPYYIEVHCRTVKWCSMPMSSVLQYNKNLGER